MTSPSEILHVRNPDSSGGDYNYVFYGDDNTGNKNAIGFRVKDSGVSAPVGEFVVTSEAGGNGTMVFSTVKNNNITEQMRITSDGNVGIGTTDPTAKLHVDGDLKVGGDLIRQSDWGVNIGGTNTSDRVRVGELFGAAGLYGNNGLKLGANNNSVHVVGTLTVDTLSQRSCRTISGQSY